MYPTTASCSLLESSLFTSYWINKQLVKKYWHKLTRRHLFPLVLVLGRSPKNQSLLLDTTREQIWLKNKYNDYRYFFSPVQQKIQENGRGKIAEGLGFVICIYFIHFYYLKHWGHQGLFPHKCIGRSTSKHMIVVHPRTKFNIYVATCELDY